MTNSVPSLPQAKRPIPSFPVTSLGPWSLFYTLKTILFHHPGLKASPSHSPNSNATILPWRHLSDRPLNSTLVLSSTPEVPFPSLTGSYIDSSLAQLDTRIYPFNKGLPVPCPFWPQLWQNPQHLRLLSLAHRHPLSEAATGLFCSPPTPR